MGEVLDIATVTKRTGLSSRALRFYETRGLIKPLRTQSGRRVYAAGDLERIHQIIALKAAGLSLADIDRLMSGRGVALKALLEAQLSALDARSLEIAEARTVVHSALVRIASGEPIDIATFCALIRSGGNSSMDLNWENIVDRFWSDDAKAQFNQKSDELKAAFRDGAWVDLCGRIKAALPLDPASEQALGFVQEWYAVLEPLRHLATREMIEASSHMQQHMEEWQGEASPGFDKDVWDFIHEASLAAHAAGHTPEDAKAWQEASKGA